MKFLPRLHLATLVVLMLSTSVFLGLNIYGSQSGDSASSLRGPGWPYKTREVQEMYAMMTNGNCIRTDSLAAWDFRFGVPVDAAIAVALIAYVTLGTELLVRRNQKKQK